MHRLGWASYCRGGERHNCITIDPGANELLTAATFPSAKLLSIRRLCAHQLEIPVAAAEAALRAGRERGAITISESGSGPAIASVHLES